MELLVRPETSEEAELRNAVGFEAAREVCPHLWRILPVTTEDGEWLVETVCALDPQAHGAASGWAEQQAAA
ncbi:hypothetical protein HY442_01000 [Candidatus Parcubacteria bacterium]|nr:hypothetical protein [Candidatus Parcubacteria bacterium]